MSNASNLSTLANVLDDGSDGQFLKSTGSGGVAFDTVAAGAVVYATADLLPLSGNSAGDMAYVTATNRFYINNGSGWYSVSLVNTNPNITSVQDAGSNTTPFTLATDGTATVVTVTAADPEDIPLTYGYSVTSGSLNGSTVTQGTGSNTNVFTVTPHASQDATFTITFTASDGINQATSANAFSLSFVTIVTDSNHTTLLATATGTSDNNNITDSSSNSHSITVNGDAHAGTFSPYRSGGYSTYFDGTGDYLQLSSVLPSGAFTVSCWAYFNTSNADAVWSQGTSGNAGRVSVQMLGSSLFFGIGSINVQSSAGSIVPKTWYYIEAQYSGSQIELFINGSSVGTASNTTNSQSTNFHVGTLGSSWDSSYELDGYVSDLKVVSGTPSGSSTVPTEPLSSSGSALHICHLPYIADGSTNSYSITVNGNVTTKPFSPYDYTEYDAADHGGSVYFDGTGDTLEIPHSTNIGAFGTNDFTVQMWYYTDAVGNQDYLIDFRQYGGNGDYLSIYKNGSNKIVVAEGGSNRITGTKDISVGQWFFITVHRDNGSLKLFVNGEQDGSTYSDSTNYVAGSSGNFIIGKNNGSASYFMEGYLSDIKVTHGSALGGTTVPTAPLSSSGAVLHIKGTDASIIDKSQGTNLKLVGNTTGSTTQVKFSNTKSMYFDGTGDRATATGVTDLGDDFTIECWLYSTTTGNRTIVASIDNVGSWGGSGYWSFYVGGGNYPQLQIDGGTTTANNTTLPTNQWVHLATTRTSNTVRYFINGTVQSTTFSNSLTLKNPSGIVIGSGPNNNYIYNYTGYIQDLRITNECKYTTSFTPPSAPLEG